MVFNRHRMVRAFVVAVLGLAIGATPAAAQPGKHAAMITNIVVIYEENHSFDNLFGGWERVDGLSGVSQVALDGSALPCLPQNDVNLTSPPLPVTCSGMAGALTINSAFPNSPFRIDDYIAPEDTTCPPPTV